MTHPSPRAGEAETIIHQYQDTVYRTAFAITHNSADTDDIFQEVFLRYFSKAPCFESEEHRKAWLIRVTINLSRSLLTSSWFRKTAAFPVDFQEPFLLSCPPELSDLSAAVMALPPKYRAVVHLYYYEDWPVNRIASVLNRREGTVQSQLMRARALLRNTLSQESSLERKEGSP